MESFRFLLDTNIVSHLIRYPQGIIRDRIAEVGEETVIRFSAESSGCPSGPNDLLIAAHARALGLTLVTHNLTEFSRVPGLLVQNWLS